MTQLVNLMKICARVAITPDDTVTCFTDYFVACRWWAARRRQTLQSRTRMPHRLVRRVPVVGRAMTSDVAVANTHAPRTRSPCTGGGPSDAAERELIDGDAGQQFAQVLDGVRRQHAEHVKRQQ